MSEWTELGALALAYGSALAGAVVWFNGQTTETRAQIIRAEKEAAAAREIMRRDADHARESLRKDFEKRIDAEVAEEKLSRANQLSKLENEFGKVIGELKSCLSLVNEKLEALPGIKAELQALGKQVDRIQPRGGAA